MRSLRSSLRQCVRKRSPRTWPPANPPTKREPTRTRGLPRDTSSGSTDATSTSSGCRCRWCTGTTARLLPAQPESEADRYRQRVSRGSVNPRDRLLAGRSRFEVVLRLPVTPVGEVVDRQVELHTAPDPPRDSQIEGCVAAGDDGGIFAVEAIVIDGAHPERSTPSSPVGEREARVGDEMRRTVDINARSGPA